MAIDSAEKRRAAAGVKKRAPRVTPTAAKDAPWRSQVARIYSGISIAAPVAVVVTRIIRAFVYRKHRRLRARKFFGGFTGILDTLAASSAAAYSVRRLTGTSWGSNDGVPDSLVRIREDSGNTEQNFSYDSNGDLDTAAITTFLSGAGGFIVTLFDQSGNGRDMSQSVAGMQPPYAASSINSKPSATYIRASSRHFQNDTLAVHFQGEDVPITFAGVLKPAGVLSGSFFGFKDGTNSSNFNFFKTNLWGAGVTDDTGVSKTKTISGVSVGTPTILTFHSNGKVVELEQDGADKSWGGDIDVGNVDAPTGLLGGSGAFMDGDMPESIFWKSELSAADIDAIQADQNAYWAVF